MLPVPGLEVRAAGTVAVSCVELISVVASTVDPHWATEAASKFVPFTVNKRSAPPATDNAGLRLTMLGGG